MAGQGRSDKAWSASDSNERHNTNGSGPVAGVVAAIARRAAQSNCTVLITGETGVGKGYLAQWLHRHSPRTDGPFVPVNCGAIPESIIDSQLFGHRKGAFSGATSDHCGLVRAAAGGTLLLDEISELPLTAQTRLLRLLQEQEIQPVGEPRPVTVDVRVIAATHRDLRALVDEHRFREDLLFRIDIVRLHVEPLRARLDELNGLIEQFNREFAQLYGQPILELTPEAIQFMRRYEWPGNIRQLRAVIERMHVLCHDQPITAHHLQEFGRLEISPEFGQVSLEDVKLDEVRRVLERSGGSVAHAAEVLGVHRSTVYRWLRNSRS